jgi:hypothetical protein
VSGGEGQLAFAALLKVLGRSYQSAVQIMLISIYAVLQSPERSNSLPVTAQRRSMLILMARRIALLADVPAT